MGVWGGGLGWGVGGVGEEGAGVGGGGGGGDGESAQHQPAAGSISTRASTSHGARASRAVSQHDRPQPAPAVASQRASRSPGASASSPCSAPVCRLQHLVADTVRLAPHHHRQPPRQLKPRRVQPQRRLQGASAHAPVSAAGASRRRPAPCRRPTTSSCASSSRAACLQAGQLSSPVRGRSPRCDSPPPSAPLCTLCWCRTCARPSTGPPACRGEKQRTREWG